MNFATLWRAEFSSLERSIGQRPAVADVRMLSGRNYACGDADRRAVGRNVARDHRSRANCARRADVDIFNEAHARTNVSVVANHRRVSFVASNRRKLAQVDVISNNCRRIDDCSESVPDVKPVADARFRRDLKSVFCEIMAQNNVTN